MTLEGVNPVVFNADKTGRQAAFAQSIMDSTGGLFEEIIDIEAAGRRRLDDGGGRRDLVHGHRPHRRHG